MRYGLSLIASAVLTEQASRIHIRRQEIAVSGESALWREARHVCRLHDVVEVLSWVTTRIVRAQSDTP